MMIANELASAIVQMMRILSPEYNRHAGILEQSMGAQTE